MKVEMTTVSKWGALDQNHHVVGLFPHFFAGLEQWH